MRQKTIVLNICRFEELSAAYQEIAVVSWRESQHDSVVIEEIEGLSDEEVGKIIVEERQEFLTNGRIYFESNGVWLGEG